MSEKKIPKELAEQYIKHYNQCPTGTLSRKFTDPASSKDVTTVGPLVCWFNTIAKLLEGIGEKLKLNPLKDEKEYSIWNVKGKGQNNCKDPNNGKDRGAA